MDSIPFEDLMKLVSILLPIVLLLALFWLDYQDNPKLVVKKAKRGNVYVILNIFLTSLFTSEINTDHMTPEDIQLTLLLILVIILIALCSWFCKRPADVPRYIQETKPRNLPTGSTCSLEKAAEMAFTTEGNLLRINTRHIYWNEPYEHAERVMIRRTPIAANNIHSIWIKNSPCAHCSSCLIHHFSMTDSKPTIYIGKTWEGDNENNRQGLENLRMEGFTLQVWDTPRNRDIQQTRNYLAEL